jgi:hypothetical protein
LLPRLVEFAAANRDPSALATPGLLAEHRKQLESLHYRMAQVRDDLQVKPKSSGGKSKAKS